MTTRTTRWVGARFAKSRRAVEAVEERTDEADPRAGGAARQGDARAARVRARRGHQAPPRERAAAGRRAPHPRAAEPVAPRDDGGRDRDVPPARHPRPRPLRRVHARAGRGARQERPRAPAPRARPRLGGRRPGALRRLFHVRRVDRAAPGQGRGGAQGAARVRRRDGAGRARRGQRQPPGRARADDQGEPPPHPLRGDLRPARAGGPVPREAREHRGGALRPARRGATPRSLAGDGRGRGLLG